MAAIAGNVYKVIYTWSGFTGQPGYTVMYFSEPTGTPQQAADTGRTFLLGLADSATKNNLPLGVKIDCPSAVDTINPTNGSLVTSSSVTTGAQIVGNGSGNFSSSTGACVTWLTADYLAGPSGRPRRVRGRTFFVPSAPSNTFDVNGTLSTTFMGMVNSSITALIAATPDLVVWHRPTAPGASDGKVFLVITGHINDKTAMLTSRRD